MELDRSFSELTEAEHATLRDRADVLAFKSGETVLEQGVMVDKLMIIRAGSLRVTQTYLDDLIAEFVGPLGPGDVFGEMSFVDGRAASATLIADGDVEVLSMSRDLIDEMMDADPSFAGRFYRSLFLDVARRLRATNLRVVPQG